jgi:ABC-type transport system substrate-binding protein
VPTLDNGEAVMLGDGADQHLETTFHLGQNGTFCDGTPVTADDVVFSWKLSLNPARPAQAGNALESKYSDVVAVNAHTVVFKMKPGSIHPLYLYGLPDVWIYPSRRLGSLIEFDPQNSPKSAICSPASIAASLSARGRTSLTAGILVFRWSSMPGPTTTAASRPSTPSSSAASGPPRKPC